MGQDSSTVSSKDGSKLTFKLTNNQGFYSPGATVTGEIKFELKTAYYAKGISLTLVRTDRVIFEVEQFDRE
jgi:hypothetical protein